MEESKVQHLLEEIAVDEWAEKNTGKRNTLAPNPGPRLPPKDLQKHKLPAPRGRNLPEHRYPWPQKGTISTNIFDESFVVGKPLPNLKFEITYLTGIQKGRTYQMSPKTYHFKMENTQATEKTLIDSTLNVWYDWYPLTFERHYTGTSQSGKELFNILKTTYPDLHEGAWQEAFLRIMSSEGSVY